MSRRDAVLRGASRRHDGRWWKRLREFSTPLDLPWERDRQTDRQTDRYRERERERESSFFSLLAALSTANENLHPLPYLPACLRSSLSSQVSLDPFCSFPLPELRKLFPTRLVSPGHEVRNIRSTAPTPTRRCNSGHAESYGYATHVPWFQHACTTMGSACWSACLWTELC